MSEYNWSKRKAILVASAAGLATAAPLFALLIFVLVPTFEDHDTGTLVSMVGGLFVGYIAAQVAQLVYLTKSPL